METLCFRSPPPTVFSPPSSSSSSSLAHHRSAAAARPPGPTEAPSSMHASSCPSSYSITPPRLLWQLWPAQEEQVEEEQEQRRQEQQPLPRRTRRGSWVLKILRVRSIWESERGGRAEQEDKEEEEAVHDLLDEADRSVRCSSCCEAVDDEDGDEVGKEIDRDVFSKLLRRASLAESEFYAKMSYLGCLAYAIPKIKLSWVILLVVCSQVREVWWRHPATEMKPMMRPIWLTTHLLKTHGLRFVTSSLERKSSASDEQKEKQPAKEKEKRREQLAEESKSKGQGPNRISALGVYSVVASAASYIHSQTKTFLPFGQVKGDGRGTGSAEEGDVCARLVNTGSLEEASFVVTSESVTAVVAAKEEVKEAVAKDLNSSQSSPCEWFICDDDTNGTRYFVIQGSETLASWQANLLFEPIQFEGMDVLVHRGIYEAAKGIYKQMLPEVKAHLESHGSSSKLRFTGHSLGGSLSLLINLMLLIRGEAPAFALLPVITFGAPSILCGGNALLEKLGLPRSHLQAITLHRDIVPRAFSCTYPDRVADILKAVNGNFRNHPCLKHQKLLFSPMGEILILQPEESFSPHHHLLPSGSGLYCLAHPLSGNIDSRKLLWTAFSVFLNNPHPLEILSDRSAYGAGGTVIRDHDVSSYLMSVQAVIRAERKRMRKAQRDHRRWALWPLLSANGSSNPPQIDIFIVLQAAKEPIKQLGRLAGSQNT